MTRRKASGRGGSGGKPPPERSEPVLGEPEIRSCADRAGGGRGAHSLPRSARHHHRQCCPSPYARRLRRDPRSDHLDPDLLHGGRRGGYAAHRLSLQLARAQTSAVSFHRRFHRVVRLCAAWRGTSRAWWCSAWRKAYSARRSFLSAKASSSTPSRRRRHGQAFAIFGLGIMVAPVAGPALGGYLTEMYSWRTVFYINIPIGIFALVLALGHLPPQGHQGHSDRLGWPGIARACRRRAAIRARSGPDTRLVQFARHRGGNDHRRVRERRLLHAGLEQDGQHHRPVAAQGPQFHRRHIGHHRLRYQPLWLDGGHAAVQSAFARLPAGRGGDAVHSARPR